MAVGNAIIGALRVVIGADSAALDKGLKQSQKSLDDFGASAAKGAAVAAGAMTAAFGAITLGISNALKEMDGFAKQSQKIGIPVEELSKLKLAADLSDVSMQQLGTGLGKLSKQMVEAAAKPTSEAARAFDALKISVVDAQTKAIRPTIDVVADISEKFAGLKDGAGKTAVSMALFGRAGAELIPLLNSGKAGLQGMMKEAEQLGIVIDTKTAKSAEAFRDNLTRLGAVKDAIFIKISAQLLPALERLSAAFVESAKEGQAAEVAAKGVGGTMLELAKHVESAVFFVGRLGETWKALKTLTSEPLNLTANWAAFKDVLVGTAQGVRDIHFTYTAFGDALRETANMLAGYTKIAEAAAGAQEDLNYKGLAGKDAFAKYLDTVKKSTEATKADAQAVGALAGFQESLRVVMQGQETARQNKHVLDAQEKADLEATALAAGNAKLQLEGLNLAHANREPMIAYQDAMEQTRLKMEAVGATSEMIGRAQEKVAQQFGQSWQNIGASIASVAGSMSNLTGVFAKENKAMAVAQKAFGIAQAVINTQIAVTKALALLGPTPAGYAAAAAAIATGAASVATILAQGFATGGSFKVPGGMGGGDKVFAPMMLEPGEQVDIWRPGQGGRDPRGGAGNQVTVRVDPGPIPREWVESLIRGLNEAIGDGHRLKLA